MDPRTVDVDLSKLLLLPMPNDTDRMELKVSETGCLSVNSVFQRAAEKQIMGKLVEIRHSPDYRLITVRAEGDCRFRFPKTGRMKYKALAGNLQEMGYQLPAVYDVDWNDKAGAWVGVLQEVEKAPKGRRAGRKQTAG